MVQLSREMEAAVADSHVCDHLARTHLASLSAMETTGSLSPAAAAAFEGLLVQLTEKLHVDLHTASKRLAWRAPGTVEPLWGPRAWRSDLHGSHVQHLVLALGLTTRCGLDGGNCTACPTRAAALKAAVALALCQEWCARKRSGGAGRGALLLLLLLLLLMLVQLLPATAARAAAVCCCPRCWST